MREGKLAPGTPAEVLERAVHAGVVSASEAALVRRAEEARAAYTAVDAFTLEEYDRLRLGASGEPDSTSTKIPASGGVASEGDGIR
jgi:hypothetical protein